MPTRLLAFQIEPLVRYVDNKIQEHTYGTGVGICYWLADGQVVEQEETVLARKESLLQWLRSHRSRDRCTWIVSCNLVYGLTLADWWRKATAAGESIVSAVLSDPPTIILTRYHGRISRYCDAMNYWRDGLRSVMVHAGVTSAERPSYGQSPGVALEWCRRKTRFVGDYLCRAIRLVRGHRLCAWQPTAASLAWSTFRHSYYGDPVYIHDDADATRLERRALYGGRVQMWRSGYVAEPVTIADANSLYPYVMTTYPLPYRLRGAHRANTLQSLKDALRGHECVAEVALLDSPYSYPVRGTHCTCHTGRSVETVLAGAELRQAVGLGAVSKVSQLAVYDAGFWAARFALDLYQLRRAEQDAGRELEASVVKLIANSFTGKWAQQRRRWIYDPLTIAAGHWCTWTGYHSEDRLPRLYRSLGGRVEYQEKGGEARDAFPAISSCITAAGRIELARALDTAGPRNVLYCDTDSLHLIRDGYRTLDASGMIHPTDLGAWKILHRGEDANYWGLKHYRVGDKYCCCYLAASAVGVSEGKYRWAAGQGFERLLSAGLPSTLEVRYRTVGLPSQSSDQHMPLCTYADVQ